MAAGADAERRAMIAFFARFVGGSKLLLLGRLRRPQSALRRQLFTGLKGQKQDIKGENKTEGFHLKFKEYF